MTRGVRGDVEQSKGVEMTTKTYEREVRNEFRKIGGKYVISDSFIIVQYGDIVIKAIAVADGFTNRIDDVTNAALSILENATSRTRKELKRYR